jgi:hypothetical protein
MFWTVLERFGPICLMALVLLVSRGLTQRGQWRRAITEAQHLRCILSVSLRNLRNLYSENLELLSRGEIRLISGRNQIGLVRPQLGRLISLEHTEIEAVLSACIAAEAAESAMSVGGRPINGAAFRTPEAVKSRQAVQTALRQACIAMEAAEGLLAKSLNGVSASGETIESQEGDQSLAGSIALN